jgi:hypothetical protein
MRATQVRSLAARTALDVAPACRIPAVTCVCRRRRRTGIGGRGGGRVDCPVDSGGCAALGAAVGYLGRAERFAGRHGHDG